MNSGFLFVSARCKYCQELLSNYNTFRSDITLDIIDIDIADKKSKRLIKVYCITGVPTLVVNNEIHSEGEKVFETLLPIDEEEDDDDGEVTRMPQAAPNSKPQPPIDMLFPSCSEVQVADNAPVDSIHDRLERLQSERKSADDISQKMNDKIANGKMNTGRTYAVIPGE